MTEHIVYCTDCKAHYSNVIVILGYINKIDFTWQAERHSLKLKATYQAAAFG